jgi:hypothetical protein
MRVEREEGRSASMRLVQAALIVIAVSLLGACENTGLRSLVKPGEGPDEFRIVPNQPLEDPPSYNALPPPTPGGANRTDQTPLQDSVAALGGSRSAAGGPIPGADGSVVNYASRFGRDPAIRSELAAVDAEFRRRRGRLTQIRIVPVDRYNQVYQQQALDPDLERARWRRAGARTPSAPPQ